MVEKGFMPTGLHNKQGKTTHIYAITRAVRPVIVDKPPPFSCIPMNLRQADKGHRDTEKSVHVYNLCQQGSTNMGLQDRWRCVRTEA